MPVPVRGPLLLILSLIAPQFSHATDSLKKGRTDVTPLQKLIQLLDEMVAKGSKEKHEEEVEFAKYKVWCDDTRNDKIQSIKEGAEKIEQLTADIAKAESDAEVLTGEIAGLEKDIAADEAELGDATGVREKEEADYLVQHKDFSESIDACARAIQVLKTRTADVPQSLLQLQGSRMIPQRAKVLIQSFLALRSDAGNEEGQPEANAYEFQSGSVISMLEKLKAKFSEQLLALEKEEMNAKANYEVLAQKLTDNISYSKKSVAKKTATKASTLAFAADCKGDKTNAEAVKADDEKTLEDTNTGCQQESKEFEKNQVTRAEEIKAINKAVEILGSGSVKGHAERYLPSAALMQSSHVALAQLRSTVRTSPEIRGKIVAFLQGRAKKLNSRYLSMVADRAAEDPFMKVKKMIKDLIVKLMEEANSEADQHAYCETELATNKQTRENKAAEVEELTAKIDELAALSSELTAEIAALADDMAALTSKRAEATKIRNEEKSVNAKTVADAKEAQLAVEAATKVLKDYYAAAGGAALLQGARSMQQEMSDASLTPYKGMQAEGGGIFGLLEVILSDFSRLETETNSMEDEATSAYDKFMNESEESLAVKETEKKHRTNKKDRTDQSITELTKERQLTQGELDAALDYYDKLKADCVDKGLSYEERVKSREAEVQSLQEALQILEGEDLAA